MNKYVDQLVKLSVINKEIDSFEPRVKKIEKTLESANEKVQNEQNDIDALTESITSAQLKSEKNESHLAELSEKLVLISKKTSAVKTEKEAKALQLEEEIAKEQCDFANEEIARLEKVIETRKEEVANLEVILNEFKITAQDIKTELDAESEIIKNEVAKVYKRKDELVGNMSLKVLTFYEKIRKWAHNTAVVPVKKQACYGCFMRINDKTNALVAQSDDIVTCPHCGRILYKETEITVA